MSSQLAEYLLNAKELIDLRFTREKRITISDFSHDATDSPDVDLFAVHVTQEELGGTIPSRCYVVRKLGAGLAELSCESEITDLQLIALRVDE